MKLKPSSKKALKVFLIKTAIGYRDYNWQELIANGLVKAGELENPGSSYKTITYSITCKGFMALADLFEKEEKKALTKV